MKLIRRKKYINFASEGAPPKRPWRKQLGKIVYYALLALLIYWLGFFAFRRLVFISGEGFYVYPAKSLVYHDAFIIDTLFYSAGDTVARGDMLAAGRFDSQGVLGTSPSRIQAAAVSRLSKTNRDIELKQVELKHSRKELETFTAELGQLQKAHALELVMAEKIEKVRGSIAAVKRKILELNDEIAVLQFYKDRVKDRALENEANSTAEMGVLHYDTIRSPCAGVVLNSIPLGLLYIAAGEPVAIVADTGSNAHIEAYFDQRYRSFLHIHQPVTCRLESGKRIKGTINVVGPMTIAQPPEFQQQPKPLQKMIFVKIKPVHTGNEALHNESLTVSFPKYTGGDARDQ